MECGAVDDARPIVRGVKLLGEESKNRRRYLPESVSPSQYEGKQIRLNHPVGENATRRVEDVFGWIEGAAKEGSDWRGDLHYNPEHPYAKTFAWLAKNRPNLIGLSHDAVGQGKTENGVFVVEKVIDVKSVDLVADPATTKGLFESMEPELNSDGVEAEELDSLETHIKNAVSAICTDDSLDLKAKVKKIKAALKLLEDGDEEEVEEEDEEDGKDGEDGEDGKKKDGDVEESLKALVSKEPGVKRLVEELDTLKTQLAIWKKTELAQKLCEDAKLPSVAITETFLAQLIEAKDEKAMKALVEDRKQIASLQRPRSTGAIGGNGKAGQMDNKTFASTLTGGR